MGDTKLGVSEHADREAKRESLFWFDWIWSEWLWGWLGEGPSRPDYDVNVLTPTSPWVPIFWGVKITSPRDPCPYCSGVLRVKTDNKGRFNILCANKKCIAAQVYTEQAQ